MKRLFSIITAAALLAGCAATNEHHGRRIFAAAPEEINQLRDLQLTVEHLILDGLEYINRAEEEIDPFENDDYNYDKVYQRGKYAPQ